MNPLLAFKLWIAIGLIALGFEMALRLVFYRQAIADEIEEHGWVTWGAAMLAAVLLGPITAAGVVAATVRRREVLREHEREREELEARRRHLDAPELVQCAGCSKPAGREAGRWIPVEGARHVLSVWLCDECARQQPPP